LQRILARVRRHAVAHKGPVGKETVAAIWRDVCGHPIATYA
jgi:homocitrate synthase NifV